MANRDWLDEIRAGLSRAGLPARYVSRVVAELADHADDAASLDRGLGTPDSGGRLGTAKRLVECTVSHYRARRFAGRRPLLFFLVLLPLLASMLVPVTAVLGVWLLMSLQGQPFLRNSLDWALAYRGLQIAVALLPFAGSSFVVLRVALAGYGGWGWPTGAFAILALLAAFVHLDLGLGAGAVPHSLILRLGLAVSSTVALAPVAAAAALVWLQSRSAPWRSRILLGVAVALVPAASASANDLVPRRKLFPDFSGETFRVAPQLSPDGTQVCFLVMTATATGLDHVSIAVRPCDSANERVFAATKGKLPIQSPRWAYTNRHILFERPLERAGGTGVYCLDTDTGSVQGPWLRADRASKVAALSAKSPDQVLLSVDGLSPGTADLYRVEVRTGQSELAYRNPGYRQVFVDESFQPRIGVKQGTDKSALVETIVEGGGRALLSAPAPLRPFSNRLEFVGFGDNGREALFLSDYNVDTQRLVRCTLETGKLITLFESPRADVEEVLFDPVRRSAVAAAAAFGRRAWSAIDPAFDRHLTALQSLEAGELSMRSWSLDGERLLVAYEMLDTSSRYYLYDAKRGGARFLFASGSTFSEVPLAKMHPVEIATRDGLVLGGYLTLPRGSESENTVRPKAPLPLVLLVHGGPYGRDRWGFHGEHQLLASRGYAALSVNYRGSEGFGKEFLEAADREWGGKVLGDLVDAAEWSVRERIAGPERIALMGSSFGGYLTLLALAKHPDTFACGIDRAGPANLERFAEEMAASSSEYTARRIGDLQTSEGRNLLREWSPSYLVDRIERPLLVFQGGRESDRQKDDKKAMIRRLLSRAAPATYLEFPQEAHSFLARETRLAYYGVIEAFLKAHLKGQAEPVGSDVNQSVVGEHLGISHIDGLPHALESP